MGSFTAVSGSIIGLMDKVAAADQGWRLAGLSLFATTEQARKLDMISKALGADLAQIVWDPELHARAQIMAEDIDRWSMALGPDFKKGMMGIRDMRMELSRLMIAGEFLSMRFASDLAKKLGIGDLDTQISKFIGDLDADKIQQWADKLSTYAIPVLKDTWEMLKGMWDVTKGAALAFTNLVGVFSNDQSIQGTEATFENLAKAVGHVEHGVTSLIGSITDAEKFLAHLAVAGSLVASGKYTEAATEMKQALKEMTAGGGAVLGAVGGPVGMAIGGAIGGAAEISQRGAGVPLDATNVPMQQGVKDTITDWFRLQNTPYQELHPEDNTDQLRQDRQKALDKWKNPPIGVLPKPQASITGQQPVQIAIQDAADRFNVPKELAMAVAKHESGFNPNATYQNKNKQGVVTSTDWGVMQLNDATVKTLGVKNPLDPMENIEAGVGLLADLLKRYQGDQTKALAAYSAGVGGVSQAMKRNPEDWFSALPDVTRKAVPEILQIEKHYQSLVPEADREVAPLTGAPQASMQRRDPAYMRESPAWYGTAPKWAEHQMPDIARAEPEAFPMGGNIPNDDNPISAAQIPAAPIVHTTTIAKTITVDVGGITVAQTNADPYQIKRVVRDAIHEELANQTQGDLVGLSAF